MNSNKCYKSTCAAFCKLKDIVTRKMPDTPYHKKAWQEYEFTLMYRSNLAQISHLVYFVFFACTGGESFQYSEKIREEWNPENIELISNVHAYATVAVLIHAFGRIILLLISTKNLNITRYYFYYELVNVMIDQFFPRNVDAITANLLH